MEKTKKAVKRVGRPSSGVEYKTFTIMIKKETREKLLNESKARRMPMWRIIDESLNEYFKRKRE
jgi:hypothetical protein